MYHATLAPDEAAIAHTIIKRAIDRGYVITVWEGGGYAVRRSRDIDAVFAALGSTDMDRVYVRQPGADRPDGWIDFVWGNGMDVVADHTDNDVCHGLVLQQPNAF